LSKLKQPVTVVDVDRWIAQAVATWPAIARKVGFNDYFDKLHEVVPATNPDSVPKIH
jgi:hypothetical protein